MGSLVRWVFDILLIRIYQIKLEKDMTIVEMDGLLKGLLLKDHLLDILKKNTWVAKYSNFYFSNNDKNIKHEISYYCFFFVSFCGFKWISKTTFYLKSTLS